VKIGFLGSGNMARSLGLRLGRAKIPGLKLFFYSPSGTKARQLAIESEGVFVHALQDFPEDLDYLFLAMKPQMLNEVTLPKISQSTVLVSMLAAISLNSLEKKFKTTRLIRIMPNTPSEIGLGVIPIIAHNSLINEHSYFYFKSLGTHFGNFIELENDKELELLTPYTGCLPGILYSYFDDLSNDLKKRNLPSLEGKNTERLMMDVIRGSVELFYKNTLSLDELKSQVTSKGGLTEKAILTMKENGIENAIHLSMNAAIKKSKEISDNLNSNIHR